MKGISIIRRCIAFFLLLVFVEQMGAGLYIHNLVHTNQEETKSSHNRAAAEISFACNCVDNFLTPFIEADELVVEPPLSIHGILPASFAESAYLTSPIFSSLRGPPAFIG